MGSSPDNAGTVQHCQMGRVRQARQTRCNGSEPVVETPQALEPARIWRIWAGQQCTPSPPGWGGDSEAGKRSRWGGHEEGLRRTRGEAAGV